ncbi:MAG: PQQ-like beta-propeller repeat protein [Opitutales bacterium]|nr:PQQ-like beta-propeller repeat protein [Opitutales bacterium]
MTDKKPRIQLLSKMLLVSFFTAMLPVAGNALPEDFQRFELTLGQAHGGDDQDMTLHLTYQNGTFLQGWVYVGEAFAGSRVDVSGLLWEENALRGTVDIVLQSGRRNNRFFVVELDASVDEKGRVSGEHEVSYGLELGHTYGGGWYIFTDPTRAHDTLVTTMDQIRFLRSGDQWSGPVEGALEAPISAEVPVRFLLDMGQPLRGPSATWQRDVFLDLVVKGDELISVDARPVRGNPWRLVEEVDAEASFDGERVQGTATINIEASYPHSGEYKFTFEGRVENNLVVGENTTFHETPHGYHGTKETGHAVRGTAERANGETLDPRNAVYRIAFKPSAGVDREVEVLIEIVDGKLSGVSVEPIFRGGGRGFVVEVLEAGVQLEGNRLHGELRFDPNNPGFPEEWGTNEIAYSFDLQVEEGVIAGEYHIRHHRLRETSGAVSGRKVPTEELRAANPSPDADWPTWHGPRHSLSAAPSEVPLIDDFAEARLLWKSERTPPARSQIQRYGRSNIGRNLVGGPGGGAASPVVYDGKVFLYYYEPSGDASTAERVAQERGRQLDETWKILADDIVVCIDLETGATLWKQRFSETGLNLYNTWKEAPGTSASVGDGKVFAVGSAGKLWAMDVNTGEVVWESTLPGFYEGMQRNRARSLEENTRPGAGSFHAGTRIVVDGLLIGTNFGDDLVAIDTETGELRWRVEDVIASQNTPSLWKGHTESVVIVRTNETIRAVTVAEGEVLWQKDVARLPRGYPVPVEGDYLTAIVEAETGEDYHLAGFRIRAEGLERLWTLEKPQDKTGRRFLMIQDGYSYSMGEEGSEHDHLHQVHLKTGEVRTLEDMGENIGSMAAPFGVGKDRVMFPRNRYRMVDTRGDLRRLSDGWSIPANTTGGYHHTQLTDAIVEGRLIVRGNGGIYAFDLRRLED